MLHFVRHAEAVSNAAAHKHPKGSAERNAEYQKQEYFNAALSEKGEQQAAEMGRNRLRELLSEGPLPAEVTSAHSGKNLCIVSTLKRTLETARIGLAHATTRDMTEAVLVPELAATEETQASSEEASSEEAFAWVATDAVREWAEGEHHPCDYRGSLRDDGVAALYPQIDFSRCADADPIQANEPLGSVHARIRELIQLVDEFCGSSLAKPRHVVVVTHSAFLSELWSAVIRDEAEKQFANCQVRSLPVAEFLQKAEKALLQE